ncbi:MAG TPA: SpoIIE family protein phosphatase [Bryobacteraceae bacterium]|nr:SpoIIE family protein phosphatase [Bryobacteraceae bacterium]
MSYGQVSGDADVRAALVLEQPPSTQMREERLQLQQKLARVQSLLEASRKMHSTILLEDVLSSVLELAAKELEAQASFLISPSKQPESRPRVYGSLPKHWTQWWEQHRYPGYANSPLPGEDGEPPAHLVVYRLNPLSMEEQDFLDGLALQASLAVKNARQHERLVEWKRVQSDLASARAIQSSLLPQAVPDVGGYSLIFRSTPCYEVGGDYVDVVPLPDGRLMMVLADVAGKGLASALISMTFRSSFRAISALRLPLPEMAARLNTLHWQEGIEARTRYVTAIFALLDPNANTVEAVNAGHTPAFVTGSGSTVKIGASGPPLGMLADRQYEAVKLPLCKGSRMLLYTDGLTEVFRGDDQFGEERLLELMKEPQGANFLDQVWDAINDFAGNSPQTDDMTALHIYRGEAGGESCAITR